MLESVSDLVRGADGQNEEGSDYCDQSRLGELNDRLAVSIVGLSLSFTSVTNQASDI